MRLINATVSGYKRLAEDCRLNLDTDPVCIVGPNAAGKSSFLDALTHLNDDRKFEDPEKTREPGGGRGEPEIEARFELDDEERELLAAIPEVDGAAQLLVRKEEEYGRYLWMDPFPRRDISGRASVRSALESLQELDWPSNAQAVEASLTSVPDPSVLQLFDSALALAQSDKEGIGLEAPAFRSLGHRIGPILGQIDAQEQATEKGEEYDGPIWPAYPANLRDLPADLESLTVHELEDRPIAKVEQKLKGSVPRFLKFDEPARDLQTDYDLSAAAPESDRGIHNFLALAGTTWERARQVSEQNDPGVTKVFVQDLDTRLRERAALQWGQSDISIAVSLNPPILSIVISMQERDYIGLDQHSDGMQAFVALRAFVARAAEEEGDEVRPIVLIDEAERHLHYDAQADLVRVLEEQDEAAQIIYSTHSAGALPRDLGLGVRAIVPQTRKVDGELRQGDHSEAVNRFWTKGRGFSPLLLAMGAGAFAFAATQMALVTEGMSDALLLPTLLREATGLKRLSFQAVPGFAEATPDEVNRFDLIAGRVAFLADGDEGGREHARKLRENGIEAEQIIFLGDDPESGLSIEDLLPKSVYLNAVNGQLRTWHRLEFPAEDLPAKGRSKFVENWCRERTGRNGKTVELSKVDVAQRVLDQRGPETKLLAKGPTAKKVHKSIIAVFDGVPDRMKRLRDRAALAAVLEAEAMGEGET